MTKKVLKTGDCITLGPRSVTKEEIIEFAEEFDPAPYHLDEEAAKASMLGGLSASGWHVCAMVMRMMCDAFILGSTSQGAPGVEYCRWKKPVHPGDTLSGETRVVSLRDSKSLPNIGISELEHTIYNQNGELVLEMKNFGYYALSES
ncbi:MAG: enoyl-CoA hydratase [Hyphomicrobiales bacterium]|nr:MAG: enoyl-CoA hydratase [Hyphomicrobiales bacterium]